MTSITITVVGGATAGRKLALVGQSLTGGQLITAVRAGAMVLQVAAKAKAPRRTSTLMRSIGVGEEEVSGTAASVRVGPSEPYGKFVEFGTGVFAEGGGGRSTPWRFKAGDGSWVTTRGQKPQPYMRPAWDETKGQVVQEIRDVMRILVEKAAAT
jgi:HK97 gp10 family phage protein